MTNSKWRHYYTDYRNRQPHGRPATSYPNFLTMKREVIKGDLARLTADLSSLEGEIERMQTKEEV